LRVAFEKLNSPTCLGLGSCASVGATWFLRAMSHGTSAQSRLLPIEYTATPLLSRSHTWSGFETKSICNLTFDYSEPRASSVRADMARQPDINILTSPASQFTQPTYPKYLSGSTYLDTLHHGFRIEAPFQLVQFLDMLPRLIGADCLRVSCLHHRRNARTAFLPDLYETPGRYHRSPISDKGV
jgi:hypothetical protein